MNCQLSASSQNSWLLMALVLNSALHLRTWALLSTALPCCISMSWIYLYGFLRWTKMYQLHLKSSVYWCCQNSSLFTCVSRIDYCNSLLVGFPQYLFKILQGAQNAAARSILRKPRFEHISPLLQNLHWLPVNRRILQNLHWLPVNRRILHYVILHCLALTVNTCLTLLMFTPLLDPCTLLQILISWALLMSN